MSRGSSVKQSFEQRAKRQGIQVVKSTNTTSTLDDYWKRFRDLPFWIEDPDEHREEFEAHAHLALNDKIPCCFWHAVGLPEKAGIPKGLFAYEQQIFNAITDYRHVWIKKATGLGITEFTLRFMAWLCLKDDKSKDTQMCLVSGPNISLATKLIERIKGLFPEVTFDTKETVVKLGQTHIEAFPSFHLDAMRSLPKPSVIYIDEADFFPPGQQQDARHVSERYIPKSDPYIIMCSTPNAPEGLFEQIEKEPDDICLYHRIQLNYEVGLKAGMFTEQEIAKARESPSFEREMNLKYIGVQGNYFSERSIQTAIKLGGELEEKRKGIVPYSTTKSMGVDSGFGDTSKTGVVVSQLRHDGYIEVIFSAEYDRPNFNDLINELVAIRSNYNVQHIYVDDSNPEVVRALKYIYKESQDWKKEIERIKTRHGANQIRNWLSIIPVNFRTEHKDLLIHTKAMLDEEVLAISSNKHNKLLIALRTAFATENNLNKDLTSHNDLLDGLQMSLKDYSLQTSV